MANNVGKVEEGMAEVLKTNDDLLKVMERYKIAMATQDSSDGTGVAVSMVKLHSGYHGNSHLGSNSRCNSCNQ